LACNLRCNGGEICGKKLNYNWIVSDTVANFMQFFNVKCSFEAENLQIMKLKIWQSIKLSCCWKIFRIDHILTYTRKKWSGKFIIFLYTLYVKFHFHTKQKFSLLPWSPLCCWDEQKTQTCQICYFSSLFSCEFLITLGLP
jgi:hypothetical protein